MSAEAEQERPTRPPCRAVLVDVAGKRRDDAETLGGVVQAEADDQQRRERDFVARRRLADRQPFGEVVQADADRDEQRQTPRRRPGREPADRAGPLA